jgi:epoxyqueuosine reductase
MGKINIGDLRLFAEQYVSTEQSRLESGGWWQTPLLSSAPIDHRFDILPRVAIDDHLHPHDLLRSARSVVAIFIPFKQNLIEENKDGDRPCRNWGLAYVETNNLINGLSQSLKSFLSKKEFKSALTPATHNFKFEFPAACSAG